MSTNPNLFIRILGSKPVFFIEIIVIVFFAFNLGKEVIKKRAIEKEVGRLEAEIGQLESDKDELGALLSYVKTDAFIQNEAREKFNLVTPGESLIVIPEVDLKTEEQGNLDNQESATTTEGGVVLGARLEKTNITKWWQYFFDQDQFWLD